MRLLESAAQSGDSSNQLYWITWPMRSLCGCSLLERTGQSRQVPEALPLHRLRRVVERMRADLATNLDLKTWRHESGYSRNQSCGFPEPLRSLRSSILLQLRVEKALFTCSGRLSDDGRCTIAANFVVFSVKNKFACKRPRGKLISGHMTTLILIQHLLKRQPPYGDTGICGTRTSQSAKNSRLR